MASDTPLYTRNATDFLGLEDIIDIVDI